MKLKNAVAPQALKHMTARCEFTKANVDKGTFSGYASIFGNVDLGGDVVERGAFARGDMMLTKDGHIRIAYSHNLRQMIGTASVEQDDVGLKFDGQLLLAKQIARDALEEMRAGILDGMSIGYDPLDDEVTNAGIRKLKRVKLWEISPVVFGMNPLAKIEAVKTLPTFETIRECEAWLREVAGLSKEATKEFVARFKKAALADRDDRGEGRDDLAEAAELKSALEFLKAIPLQTPIQ